MRKRCLPIDLVFAQVEARHLTDESLTDQVWELVGPPAAATRVWLGGISLGGYLALCAARSNPQALAGLCLLAPYLGSHIVTGEVARAGLERWQPAPLAADDDERRIWRFIQSRPAGLPIHLGLGRDDRFAARHRVLARLPCRRRKSTPLPAATTGRPGTDSGRIFWMPALSAT